MFPASRTRLAVALMLGSLVAGLLPATVLAASPTAVDQTLSTNEDVALPIVLTGTDPDGDALTFAIDTPPTNGSLSLLSPPDCDSNTPSTCTVDVTYTPNPNTNGSDSFVFSVDDGIDTADTGTVDITIDPRNDPPAGTNNTVSTLEDTQLVFSAGQFGFSDPVEGDSLAAVKITSLPTGGILTNNGTAVVAGDEISPTALGNGDLVYLPDEDQNGPGYDSFTFKVRDDGGTANGGVDLDPTANTMTIDVTAVNDRPTGADNTVGTPEDTAYTFATADFGFSDPNDNPADTLQSVKIVTLPTPGSLTLNGSAVSADDDIPGLGHRELQAQVHTRPQRQRERLRGFTFKVQDDGGTANGGHDLDHSRRTP